MIWLKMLVVMIPTEVPPEGSLAQREGGQWACVYMGFPFPERECSDKCYHRQMLDQSVARDYCSRGATTNHGGGVGRRSINRSFMSRSTLFKR